MNSNNSINKNIIGRAELINFPALGIANVPAKIDTGAYLSSVHASNIRLKNDGKTLVFTLFGAHPIVHDAATQIETEKFRVVTVENSFGHQEQRFEVELKVSMNGKIFTTPFTLANRGKKVFPVLVGRKLLNRRFVVDSSKASVHSSDLKNRYNLEFDVDVENDRV